MSAPLKSDQLCMRGRLSQVGLVLTTMFTLIVLLAFGPIVPKAALGHLLPASGSTATNEQAWVGDLADPATGAQSLPAAPLSSASYTSGFDKAAAGVAPVPVPPTKSQEAHDPHACPSDFNCSFRTAKVLPPRRPQTNVASAPPAPAVQPAPPGPRPNMFAALTSRLPSPHMLLTPFTFAADTFTGFVRKL